MTVKPNLSRSEQVRQRRDAGLRSTKAPARASQVAKQAYRPEIFYTSGTLRMVKPTRTVRTGSRQGRTQQYAFTLGRTAVHAPALALPQLGPRLVSGLATALLLFLLYTLWTSPTFMVAGVELRGNQRISLAEVNTALVLTGQPIFKAVPVQISESLRAAFPDLSAAKVHVGLPNLVSVDVVERTPVLAWTESGAVTWIDANGVAFQPRGTVDGLIKVAADGTPPRVQTDPQTPLYARPYIDPQMVTAMATLNPYLPAGVGMTYDPTYGMGWQDTRGWSVYFGQNTDDIPMKIHVYQAIVDHLTGQGIQPTLISVEYLDAPFYK